MICIIPARGGSKRIPHKNIKWFLGKPIITYPIETALLAQCETIVSTDDDEIADVVWHAGAEVHSRLPSLAGDNVETEEVLYDFLKQSDAEIACMLYPTSVFAVDEDITEAKHKIEAGKCDLVYSVVRFTYPIQRALRMHCDKKVEMVNHDHRNSQDIPLRYHDAAQFYVFDVITFLRMWEGGLRLLELDAIGVEYQPHEVQDIDTIEDWKIAEMKYRGRR